jgi:hypothetical protein
MSDFATFAADCGWEVSSSAGEGEKGKTMTLEKLLEGWGFKSLREVAVVLAESPTESTRSMSPEDRINGIETMLSDLHQLASADGCIAAGWAMEVLIEAAFDAEPLGDRSA